MDPRLDSVLRALDSMCAGNPQAAEWLSVEGGAVSGELQKILVAGYGRGDAVRQLAGVTLRRCVKNGTRIPEGGKGEVMKVVSDNTQPKTTRMAAADVVAEVIIQEKNPEEVFIRNCVQTAVNDPAAYRLLISLAHSSPGPLNQSLHENVVKPVLGTPVVGLLPIVRVLFQKYPVNRQDVGGLLASKCFQAVNIADFVMVTDVMKMAAVGKADQVAGGVFQIAVEVFRQYAARIVAEAANGEDNHVAGYYSEVTAVHATIHAVAGFVSSVQPTLLLAALPYLIQCACEGLEDEQDDDLDCSLTVDTPGTVRDASVWLVSLLLKDPDDGGPTPPIPNIKQIVSTAINSVLSDSNPRVVEAGLYCCQRLCESGYLTHDDVPVNGLLGLMECGGLSEHVRARASIAASALANNSLPAEQHSFLINHQWGKICDPTVPHEIRVKSAIGLSKSLASTLNNPGTKEKVQIGPSISPLLEMLPAAPLALIETVDVVLQVLPEVVLTHGSVKEILPALMSLLQTNHTHTRLCARVLRVVCQSIIEEHQPGPVCGSILEFSMFIMTTILSSTGDEAMGSLAASALDVGATLCCRRCDCSTIASKLCEAISGYRTEGKMAIRSGCRAMALSCSVSKERGQGVPGGLVAGYILRELKRDCDVACKMVIAASTVSLCGHLTPEELLPVAMETAQQLSTMWSTQQNWHWPPHLALPWALLPPSSLLTALGPSPIDFLQAWLTLDAIVEPSVRPISTAAALSLLQGSPPGLLATPVQLTPIKTIYRRKPASENITVPLSDALCLAVLRVTDKPLVPYAKTFLSKDVSIVLPTDPQIQNKAMAVLGSLPPEKRASLQQLLNAVSCKA